MAKFPIQLLEEAYTNPRSSGRTSKMVNEVIESVCGTDKANRVIVVGINSNDVQRLGELINLRALEEGEEDIFNYVNIVTIEQFPNTLLGASFDEVFIDHNALIQYVYRSYNDAVEEARNRGYNEAIEQMRRKLDEY